MFKSIAKGIGSLFGGGKQNTATTTNTVLTPVLPANVLGAQGDLIERTRAFAATPYEQYTGARVAGFTPKAPTLDSPAPRDLGRVFFK